MRHTKTDPIVRSVFVFREMKRIAGAQPTKKLKVRFFMKKVLSVIILLAVLLTSTACGSLFSLSDLLDVDFDNPEEIVSFLENMQDQLTESMTYYVKTDGEDLEVWDNVLFSNDEPKVIGHLPNGSAVLVGGFFGDWAAIEYEGYTYFVESQYLSEDDSTFFKPIQKPGVKFASWLENGFHHDIPVELGTPVYAIAAGTIECWQAYTVINGEKKLTSYGNHIRFTSTDGTVTVTAIYAHLNGFYEGTQLDIPSDKTQQQSGSSGKIQIGETKTVKRGELIGYVGSTGNSSGPHLHFELTIDGKRVDPPEYIEIYE